MFKWILLAACWGLLLAVWDVVNPYPKKDKPRTKWNQIWDTIFWSVFMVIVLLSLLGYLPLGTV